MKTFPLRTTTVPLGPEKMASYKDLMLICLNYDGDRKGFSYEDIAGRQRVIQALESSETVDEVVLEDADAQRLTDCVNAMRWAQPLAEIANFVMSVRTANSGS